MALPIEDSSNTRAVLRQEEAAALNQPVAPWEQEGEFQVDALIMSQTKGELLVKVPVGDKESYLTISGFLPGKVTGQRWKLECVRESGLIELLDGEPLA